MTTAIFQGFNGIRTYQNYIIVESNDGNFQLPNSRLPQLINALSKKFWLVPFNLSDNYMVTMPSETMSILLINDGEPPQTLLELSFSNLTRFKQELAKQTQELTV